MGKGKSQTIGYHYLFSLLWGLCRGPINELVTIRAGDKDIWGGNLCTSDAQYINQPEVFGGEKKEGGVQGPFRLFMGARNQVLPGAVTVGPDTPSSGGSIGGSSGKKQIADKTLPGVKETVGGSVSEFRGVVTLWFDGLITSMNPYPKEWKFRVRRSNQGWWNNTPWYREKATIYLADGTIHAMNAAHMIYECSTNPEWGRGLPADMIDENSFIYAANRLCLEQFGLCMVWYRKEDIDNFIQTVLDHIGGVIYTDRETGKLVLRLIRDDYAINDVPLFTPDTGLLDIRDDDSQASETAYSEVIVTGHSPLSDETIQARAHNIAAFQAQGSAASTTNEYTGLPTVELCTRVAQRDLRVHTAGLKKFTVTLDRRAWRVAPGSVIRISHPKRGIGMIVLRVGEIDDGNMVNGEIKLKGVQDVFGLPATSYVKDVPSTWTPPGGQPLPSPDARVVELGYRDLLIRLDQAEFGAIGEDDTYMGEIAVAPNGMTPQYDLWTRAEGESTLARQGTFGFMANGILDSLVEPLDTEIVLSSRQGFPEPEDMIDTALLIDNEIMRIDAWDEDTMTFTVARGAADTIPVRHLAGARVWLYDDDMGTDARIYAPGETVHAKVLPRTSSDIFPLELAEEHSAELNGRQIRPYPPADVKVNGDSIYALSGLYVEPMLTWVPRNRVTQADQLVGHVEPGVDAEVGTTYRVTVFNGTTQIGLYDDIEDLFFEYDSVKQAADGASGTVRLRLQAKRDGHLSNAYENEILIQILSGYGYGYGLNYGGQEL